MTFALARSLLLADAVKPEALAEALLVSATRGTSLVRALVAARAIDPARLDQHLERADVPYMRHVAPVAPLVQELPPELCERLLALPVRRDPLTGTVDVAVVDARDPHAVEEIAYWLKAPVRMVRTSLAAMEAALHQLHAKPDPGMRPGADEDRAPVALLVKPAPNFPIPLMPKSVAPVPIVDVGPNVPSDRDTSPEPATDPILDLRRRKTVPPASAPPLGAAAGPGGDGIPPAPATTRGPFSPSAPWPPFDDLTTTLTAIRAATERDVILELLLAGIRPAARLVAVFAVKREALVGWTCTPEMGDRAIVRTVRMALPADSVLSTALATGDALLARIPKDAAHAPLLAAVHSAPAGEVALVAVRVEDKPVALVVVDEIGDTMAVTKRMQEVARAAGEAFARLLRDRRK